MTTGRSAYLARRCWKVGLRKKLASATHERIAAVVVNLLATDAQAEGAPAAETAVAMTVAAEAETRVGRN
jgi:hypothetical protein